MKFITMLAGVALATSAMAQDGGRSSRMLKSLAPEIAPKVAQAAQNPRSIRDMEIPAEQLPIFLATTSKAIESSLNFMDKQALGMAEAAHEVLEKARSAGTKKLVLSTAFAVPMVQALPTISEKVRPGLSQVTNNLDNAQYAAVAKEVVGNTGTISAGMGDAENVVAVRMALAAALFVTGAKEDGDELAVSLNALLPADYQGPFDESGSTLVTMASLLKADGYRQMTQATGVDTLLTGVDILIEQLLPPPPPPPPFNPQLQRDAEFLEGLVPGSPDLPLPPIPDPYSNQCGCRRI